MFIGKKTWIIFIKWSESKGLHEKSFSMSSVLKAQPLKLVVIEEFTEVCWKTNEGEVEKKM